MTWLAHDKVRSTNKRHRTFQQSAVWPLSEVQDPKIGWDFTELLVFDAGKAVHDIYGKLYAQVGSILGKFKHHLSDTGARFELHNINLLNLPDVYEPATFDQIEVCTTAIARNASC